MPENLLLNIIFLPFGKARFLLQQNMSEFSVDQSLQYPYPVQWYFKNFHFQMHVQNKLWHKIASFRMRSTMKPQKCESMPTFRIAFLTRAFTDNHSDLLNNLLGIILSDFKAYLLELNF